MRSLSEAQLYLQQQRSACASMWCEAPLLACAKTAVEAAFVMQINSTFLPSIKHLDYRSWLDQQFKGKFTLTTTTPLPFQLKQGRRLAYAHNKIKSCSREGGKSFCYKEMVLVLNDFLQLKNMWPKVLEYSIFFPLPEISYL